MAAQGNGPSSPGIIQEYIRRNIYIKYFLVLFILLGFSIAGVYLLASTEQGLIFVKYYNETLAIISGLLSYIPVYNLWTGEFNAYQYYFQYMYELNSEFFNSPKEIIFIEKFYIEIIPLILANFFFVKNFFDLRKVFTNYYSTIKYRNLKLIDNPIKELEKGLNTEGVKNDEYNEDQLKAVLKYYHKNKFKQLDSKLNVLGLIDIYKIKLNNNIKLYYDSLFKLKLELDTQEKWDNFFEKIIDEKKQPYEYLKLFMYKNIDYNLLEKKDIQRLKNAFKWELHFKYHNVQKKWISREFYVDSIEKCINNDEIYKYYYSSFLFWINKQWTNFPMYIYSINLDVPGEWKKLAKWTDGLNAPGKTEIIVGKQGKKLILKTTDLYFRLYMFRNYLGIECEYMVDYILMINEKYGI